MYFTHVFISSPVMVQALGGHPAEEAFVIDIRARHETETLLFRVLPHDALALQRGSQV
jgi:hypothetical protein